MHTHRKSMLHRYKNLLKHYSFYLGGDQPQVPWVERIRSVFGAFIGLTLVLTIAKYLGEQSGLDEWLMASLGASALLVFALPGSPMAQPWAVIAGNTVSALIGAATFIGLMSPCWQCLWPLVFLFWGCFSCVACTHQQLQLL